MGCVLTKRNPSQILCKIEPLDFSAGTPGVLIISGSTTLAMEGQIAGADNVAFLRKPFDSQTLLNEVAAVMEAILQSGYVQPLL